MVPEISWRVYLAAFLFGFFVVGPAISAEYAIELQAGDTLTVTVTEMEPEPEPEPEPPTEPNPEPPSGDYCVAEVIQSGYGVDLQDGERLAVWRGGRLAWFGRNG